MANQLFFNGGRLGRVREGPNEPYEERLQDGR